MGRDHLRKHFGVFFFLGRRSRGPEREADLKFSIRYLCGGGRCFSHLHFMPVVRMSDLFFDLDTRSVRGCRLVFPVRIDIATRAKPRGARVRVRLKLEHAVGYHEKTIRRKALSCLALSSC